MEETQQQRVQEVGEKNQQLVVLKKKDLKILKAMNVDRGGEEDNTQSIIDITEEIYGIDGKEDRKELQDKYSGVKYRMDKLAGMGVLSKGEVEGTTAYTVSHDNVFIGEFEGEMTFMGHTEEVGFDQMMFLNIDGNAVFISLDNIDGV